MNSYLMLTDPILSLYMQMLLHMSTWMLTRYYTFHLTQVMLSSPINLLLLF